METAGLARIFPWLQILGSSDVQFAKRINHQVMGYPLTLDPISCLHQSHGKAPFSVQLVGERKMQWKERGQVHAQWLHNFVMQYQCGFFSGSESMSFFFLFLFLFFLPVSSWYMEEMKECTQGNCFADCLFCVGCGCAQLLDWLTANKHAIWILIHMVPKIWLLTGWICK